MCLAIVLFLLRRMSSLNLLKVASAAAEYADGPTRERIACNVVDGLDLGRVKRLWSHLGTKLNVAKDGHLDRGRPKEGN